MSATSTAENTPAPEETRDVKKKGPNFTVEEDAQLCRSWLDVHQDPVIGNEQKGQQYWKRIFESFQAAVPETERNASGVQNRFSVLQASINKFSGFLSQVQAKNQSGKTEEDKINDAMKLYKTAQNSTFRSRNAWEILRNAAKWKTHCETKTPIKKKRKTPPSSASNSAPPSYGETPAAADGEPEENAQKDPKKRPLGKKTEKRLRADNERVRTDNEAIEKILQSSVEAESDRKAALEESKRATAAFLRMEEDNVMEKDLSSMTPSQKVYWEKRQEDVLKAQRERSILVDKNIQNREGVL